MVSTAEPNERYEVARNDDNPDPLARLTALHPTLVWLATLALFLGVLLLPGWAGAVLVLAVVAALAALLRRTWPVLAPGARTLRLVVLGLLVAVAITKITI
jgi:hypothetical protein